MNDTDFTGQRVLVVGGSSGIGNGMAQAFRARGAEVHVWGTRATAQDYAGMDGSDLTGLAYQGVDVGDRIMVRPGSRAVLQYGPNCRVNVVPGEVVTITETPVCAASDGTNPRTQVSDGGGTVKKLDSDQFEFGFGGFNPGYVIIGGALIAGGLLITLNTPSDNPTSP